MSGSFQSHDYVPGMSGLRIDLKTGEFELNSCTLGSAANAPERQMVSIEVASWSKWDLPKNAANLLQFMQAELERVPEQYRATAEFEEYDASYDDESLNARLFLSYSRLETEEELAGRLEKAKLAGTRINLAGGVLSISRDGVPLARIGALETGDQPQPFVVVDGETYIRQAFVDDASINAARIAASWSVKMQLNGRGQYVVAGIGMGLASQFLVSADRFAVNGRDASEILRDIASKIGETSLGQELKEQIERIELIGLAEVNKRLDELEKKQGAENRAISDRIHSQAASLQALIAKRT